MKYRADSALWGRILADSHNPTLVYVVCAIFMYYNDGRKVLLGFGFPFVAVFQLLCNVSIYYENLKLFIKIYKDLGGNHSFK